jgi:hypothetical protein
MSWGLGIIIIRIKEILSVTKRVIMVENSPYITTSGVTYAVAGSDPYWLIVNQKDCFKVKRLRQLHKTHNFHL